MQQRAPGRDLSDAMVRVGGAMAIPEVLRSLGAEPAQVLADLGLQPDLFDNADNLMSYADRGRLFARCVHVTGCQHFGLLVGQRGGLGSLGLVGLLVKYSPDVRTALESLERYLHLHVRGATTSIEVRGELALLAYDIHEPHVQATRQIGDGAAAAMFNMLQALCGSSWNAAEVQLAHQAPADAGPFRRFFQAPLHFDAERYAVVFASRWLKHPLPGGDTDLCRLLQEQIDALDVRHGDQFPEQVRSVLRTALLTRHATADQVAALFSIHSRTLARRLSASGTSFQELLDEGRFASSRQMLENTGLPVSQIAASLDYADASAFTRAFRRWSGTTPARWRDQHRRTA